MSPEYGQDDWQGLRMEKDTMNDRGPEFDPNDEFDDPVEDDPEDDDEKPDSGLEPDDGNPIDTEVSAPDLTPEDLEG